MSVRRNEFGQAIGTPLNGWSPRPRPSREDMLGRYCRLEPVSSERHGAQLYAAYQDAPDGRDWTYLFYERPESPEAFSAYLLALEASKDPLHFTIVDLPTGAALGTAALMRIDPTHGSMEVGSINFAPRLKQTAAATESMYLMMRRAFDDWGYRRYEWKCDSLNEPSRAAAVRYGFSFEGIFRNAIVYKGRNRDTAWYSITDREWPLVRSAFQAWLAAGNFDGRGRQKQRLQDFRAK